MTKKPLLLRSSLALPSLIDNNNKGTCRISAVFYLIMRETASRANVAFGKLSERITKRNINATADSAIAVTVVIGNTVKQ